MSAVQKISNQLNRAIPNPSATDPDPVETREWLEAFESVFRQYGVQGQQRARYLLEQLNTFAADMGVEGNGSGGGAVETPYVNTIGLNQQSAYPGDLPTERELQAYLRWNAMTMVLR
ncbi:MAG: hypothetical protein HKM24_02995, partial [Gammaproteobacteria bacterium]|nr:hypothetical protein [Gammaproteobacteria bacterium]